MCRIVDAKDYFEQVAHAMLAAKEEIYITDWMLVAFFFVLKSTLHILSYHTITVLPQTQPPSIPEEVKR